jgi:imidazole glycerol-phosphate synthase subunit HisF
MLKTRVIPTMLWKDLGLVKGIGFNSWRRVGAVMPVVKIYNSRDVDELILLDITATNDGREPDEQSIKSFASECFVPLTIGGGIKKLSHIEYLLSSGADKVSINSQSYKDPSLIKKSSNYFGSQCIISSIDFKKIDNGKYSCFSNSGTKNMNREPVEWAKELEQLGCGEILLTSIELDGSQKGYDIEIIKKVSDAVKIPVIASGGAGSYDHMISAIKEGGASAVAAASIFHFTDKTPAGAKEAMKIKNIPVRDCFKVNQ